MAASHATRRRPVSAHTHSGRWAVSSIAHAESASGTEQTSRTTKVLAISDQSMSAP
jgi:hypothetical protein